MTNYDKMKYDQLTWSEKHRPVTMNDIVLDNKLKNRILNFIENNNIPNLILTGSAGIGKSSTVKCIGYELYGQYANKCILELNASDDKGIKQLQSDIITFCKIKMPYKKDEIDKYTHLKLIVLDGADNMDERTQPQINSVMESFKDSVRFIFTCNSSSNIIEAIQSRCIILRYVRPQKELIIEKLKNIADIEKVKYDNKALDKISEISRGDIRSAINILQLLSYTHEKIKEEHIDKLYDLPQIITIKKMFNHLLNNDLLNSFVVLFELKNNGYSGSDIMLGMIYTLKNEICNDIPENKKIKIFNSICMATYRISKGIDSLLQLSSCLVDIIEQI